MKGEFKVKNEDVQKAINFIHACMHPTSDSEYEQLKRKYRDMAIEALEKEPCENAVSRNAVIKAVDVHTNEDGTLDDDISIILEDLPSVTLALNDDVINKLKTEIEMDCSWFCFDEWGNKTVAWTSIEQIIDKYKKSNFNAGSDGIPIRGWRTAADLATESEENE